MGGSGKGLQPASMYPAVIVCFRRTAGSFPQEADHVCRLSVNRGHVKSQQFFVLVVCVGLWESSVGGLFNIPHVCDCNAVSIHIAPKRYQFQDRLPAWNISPVSFIPAWNWAPAWGRAPVSAAAVFIVLHRAGERKEESCQQLPAINRARAVADLWWPRLLWRAVTRRG